MLIVNYTILKLNFPKMPKKYFDSSVIICVENQGQPHLFPKFTFIAELGKSHDIEGLKKIGGSGK